MGGENIYIFGIFLVLLDIRYNPPIQTQTSQEKLSEKKQRKCNSSHKSSSLRHFSPVSPYPFLKSRSTEEAVVSTETCVPQPILDRT